MRVLSAEQISVRLDDSFRLLAGSDRTALVRQRTLRATMDWSYGLLTREEQTLLGNLSVFAGGFTLGAVEAVYAGERAEEILDLLASLVDKSLVIVEERDGEARYRLLETVRQYGREKLQESDEVEPVRRRHAEYYLALAEEPEPDLREQGAWLLRLGAEQDNFRAALRWTLGPEAGAEDPELGLRLATALGHRRFWAVYGLGEGLAWFERGLERDEAASKSLRAEALSHAGWIANVQGNYDKARGLLEENYSVSKEIGQNQSVAVSLIQLGQFLTMHGSEKERIEELRAETEALLPELSDPQLTGPLLIFLGLVALNKDDYPRTTALLEEGLRLFREIGDPYGTAICCGTLGFVALHQDDVMTNAEVARELFISPRTVNAHMGSVYHKIGSSTRAEAARFATEHDLL